jgi:hypothetical protein
MVVGECMHLINSFVCSEGRNQNFPCPYRDNFKKCNNCVIVSEEMSEKWNKTGCVCIPLKKNTI